jgi:hypothetical protein
VGKNRHGAASFPGFADRYGFTITDTGMVIAENFEGSIEKNPHLLVRQLFFGIDPLHVWSLLSAVTLVRQKPVMPYQQEGYQSVYIVQLAEIKEITEFCCRIGGWKGYNVCHGAG